MAVLNYKTLINFMRRNISCFAYILFLALQLCLNSDCFADVKEVRIGILAFRPVDITKQQWQPTADYLNSKIPDYHFSITPLNYTDLDLAVNRRDFDFVLTNPEHYITIREDHGINAIATLMPSIAGHPYATFGGVIFTRSDRTDIKDIDDIKDKVVSSPTKQSLGGYSMQIWTLLKKGIQQNQIKQFRFTGMPHDNVVQEVIEGKADVGFVRTGVLEAMARDGKIRLDQIKILNRQPPQKFPLLLSTDLYSEWPLAAELDVPQSLIKLVAMTLLNIEPNDRAAQIGQYYGFASTGDYSAIESLMKRISENPERAHEFEIKDIVRKYSIQLQLGSLIIILGVLATAIYLFRVNKTIRKISLERESLTEELEEVNSELEAANQNLESTVEERTAQLRESEQQAQHAMLELQLQKLALDEHAIVSITDVTGTMTYVNDKFCQISQYSRDELIGQDHILVNSSYHPKEYFGSMYRDISGGKVWHNEVCNRAKDGSLYWLEMTVVPFKDKNGKIYQYISISTDITSRKKSEIEIQNLAFNDPLTGLSNRRMFMDRLKHSLASNIRNDKFGAILFLDLDNFKTLNDTKGHSSGDELLKEVGRRLTSCLRNMDTVARFGGDEFVILVEGLSSNLDEAISKVDRLSRKILHALVQPYFINEFEIYSSCSIGVAMFCDNNVSIEEILKHADSAMYLSKKAGRNTIRFYDPNSQAVLEYRSIMETQLRNALKNEELQLHYQIQVNDKLIPIGAEVLLRWTNTQLGNVSPGEFIPLAEETGLIVSFGQWVLRTACSQLKIWESNPLTCNLELAVNVSIRQFKEAGFVADAKKIIKQSNINPARLKLEITESMISEDIESTIGVIKELKTLGVKFSMDDFGTGYSSLSNIKRIPLDQIKIDQSFVRDLSTSSQDRSIVRTIIAMAESLNLEVIAEGVENEEQKILLTQKGCNNFQGYLFGRPVPIEELEKSLK